MPQPPSREEIEQALETADAARLATWVGEGLLEPGWKSASGAYLLHFAAEWGDAALAGLLLDKGAEAFVHNATMETPAVVAAIFGYDECTKILAAAEKASREKQPVPPPAFKALEEIRAKSSETGINQFYLLAARGLFSQVTALAEIDAGGLRAEDLLAKGGNGDTVLLRLCQTEQLALLAKPALWINRPADLQIIRDEIPEIYRKEMDFDALASSVRQARLKSGQKHGFKL